ncbi:hypothetical protein BDM02DRAFT_3190330 [Thelephora ganbajun]|uniref:Uncharacterized protein n=1 Tax=Thelephora ganbajun TaxID=370292 RepID=A0ACB6Z5F2_THEGA|nr:hypothetical protein BDM02DRAFT_3190330 [Thelephora ganbajun]
MAQLPSQPRGGNQEPVKIQLDPKSLHSAFKELFDPPRTNDPRTDFFTVYRRESGDFDRDYAGKYDEDLNTSLIFAGLFSAVSSAFITSVQSKLESDPNEMTAAYMRVLIHAVNNTLFPDADPGSVTWTGPPPDVVTVQSLLYASLATSLLAAFLAMLGRQWVSRYVRNHGGSAADKSRDRQRKLDGLERWYFNFVIESVPVMLQLALLLLWVALSLYLWAISRIVAMVILTFTVFGAASYVFFTFAAMFHYDCPYQTPPSIFIRTFAMYLAHSSSTFACSARSCVASLVEVYSRTAEDLRRSLSDLHSGVRRALRNFGRVSSSPDIEHAPPAVVEAPGPLFGGTIADLEVSKADARCIFWVLDSITDSDVILSTVHFAVDMIWYPEIAGTLQPDVLLNLLLECLVDGRVLPGRLEHANMIGMALASVFSIQLSMEPDREDLQDLRRTIHHHTDWVSSSDPTFLPGVAILRIVSQIPELVGSGSFRKWEILSNMSDHLPTAHKLCLSRTILQTIWRWRRRDPITAFNLEAIELFCRGLMANGDHILPALKINCLLIMAISLGHQVGDVRAFFIPNDRGTLDEVILGFHQRLQTSIMGGMTDSCVLTSVLSALGHLDLFRTTDSRELGFLLVTRIVNSRYLAGERYRMASQVVQLLGGQLNYNDPQPLSIAQPAWIPSLVGFLSLCKSLHTTDPPTPPWSIALRILSTILPTLTSALSPDHPLRSRCPALKVFYEFMFGWFSSQMENVTGGDLGDLVQAIGGLIQAVGDPFEFTLDLPLHDGRPGSTVDYEPMTVVVSLIELASSDLWQNHLSRSNFTSCEEILSTREDRRIAFGNMLETETRSSGFLRAPARITAAITRLAELQCSNTAEAVILWARTNAVGDATDHDAWRLMRGPLTREEEEAIAVEGVGEETNVSLGRSVIMPIQFTDWACDYP